MPRAGSAGIAVAYFCCAFRRAPAPCRDSTKLQLTQCLHDTGSPGRVSTIASRTCFPSPPEGSAFMPRREYLQSVEPVLESHTGAIFGSVADAMGAAGDHLWDCLRCCGTGHPVHAFGPERGPATRAHRGISPHQCETRGNPQTCDTRRDS